MNNEDKILQILTSINGRLDIMQGDISALKSDVSELKGDVSGLKTDVSELKADVSELKADLSETKGQASENTEIIKAILHNQEHTNAKLEGLELTTAKADVCATKEDLRTIENKLNVLNTDLFNQRADIVGLKLVK